MKKIVALCISIAFIFTALVSFAAPEGYDTSKIEQVYARMPEIKAYLQLSKPIDGRAVSGFVDANELTLTGHAPFDREEGVSFVFMFDCSGSVTSSQMKAMKKAVVDFVKSNTYSNDKYTIISFGERIDILADGSNTAEEVIAAVNSMKNNQNTTVLYDAVKAVKQISDNADSTYPKKSMCVIFTDAVNDNVGGTTGEEVIEVARTAGTPIYAVAINPNIKESIDSLGAIARASGGDVCVATGGNIDAAFKKAVSSLDTVYEISFTANTNKALLDESTLSIRIGDKASGDSIERKFNSTAWTADNEAPYVVSAEAVSDKELHVIFSESVENAGKTESYSVKKGSDTFKIKDVRYDDKTRTAVISLDEYISNGSYEIVFSGITDCSMEKNALSDSHTFKVTGYSASMASIKNFGSSNGGWLIAILVIIIVAVSAYVIIKKRNGIIVLDNKATFGDNIKYEHKAPKSLPTHYLKLTMETADGGITNLDINIVQSIIFGRAETCEVTVDDSSLSRQHFAIELEDGMLFIQNLSQTNGTLLNGIPLAAKRKLELGDVISAGQERFTVSKI